MERPYVVDGFCSSEFDFGDYRACDLRPDPPPEAVAVVVRGGLHKVAKVVERYPESVAVERFAAPRGAVITVVEAACCIQPRALGNSLLYASSKPLRLELTFAEIFVHYVEAVPPGSGGLVYRREVDVKRFKRGVRLKPLHPALIEYLASHEQLQNYYYLVDPPNRLVVHLDDDVRVYVTFGDGGPKIDVKFLRPTILAYSAGYAEKVVRKLGLTA